MNSERPITILLVDDDALIAMATKAALEAYGYRVLTAFSGEKAVQAFKKLPDVDLILMDINLGAGMDGTEAAGLIMAERDLPVVFLSSHTEPEIVARTEKITSYGYVVKDSSATVLDASIKMALKLYQAKRNELAKERQREAALEALRESEAKFRGTAELLARRNTYIESILDNMPIGFAANTVDDGAAVYMNPSFTEIYGWPKEALTGVDSFFEKVYPGPEGQELKARVMSDIMSGDPKRMAWDDLKITTRSGERRYISARNIPILDQNLMVSTVWDTTRMHDSLQALRNNEARLRILVDILQHPSRSNQEFLDYALGQALELTGSKIGYIYHYSEDRREFVLNTWSRDVMAECAVADPQTCYALDRTGIWGEAVRQRRPILVNDYPASHPLKRGYPKGHVRLLKFMTVPIFEEGRIVGVIGLANKEADYDETDILQVSLLMEAVWKVTERRRAEEETQRQLAEKALLLREVHHRIKNNIASIGGLLSLHLRSASNPEAVAALQDALGRITSMRILYDKLLAGESYQEMSVKKYLESLADAVVAMFPGEVKIRLEARIADIPVDARRLFSLGIIVNELLTNIMKHAFAGRETGLIALSLERADGRVTLSVRDDGIGLPDGFDLKAPKGFGLALVKMLSQQLGGRFAIESRGGTRSLVEFNL